MLLVSMHRKVGLDESSKRQFLVDLDEIVQGLLVTYIAYLISHSHDYCLINHIFNLIFYFNNMLAHC